MSLAQAKHASPPSTAARPGMGDAPSQGHVRLPRLVHANQGYCLQHLQTRAMARINGDVRCVSSRPSRLRVSQLAPSTGFGSREDAKTRRREGGKEVTHTGSQVTTAEVQASQQRQERRRGGSENLIYPSCHPVRPHFPSHTSAGQRPVKPRWNGHTSSRSDRTCLHPDIPESSGRSAPSGLSFRRSLPDSSGSSPGECSSRVPSHPGSRPRSWKTT